MAASGQTDMYTLTYIYGYLPIRRSTSHPESFILASIYIDLYGYRDRLTRIRSAVRHVYVYLYKWLSADLPTYHPEYTYRAYHIYI